jgi:hypothetical protein
MRCPGIGRIQWRVATRIHRVTPAGRSVRFFEHRPSGRDQDRALQGETYCEPLHSSVLTIAVVRIRREGPVQVVERWHRIHRCHS